MVGTDWMNEDCAFDCPTCELDCRLKKVKLVMRATTDYDKLVPFFIENEIEYSGEEPVSTDIVKCWEVTRQSDGKLLGACVLAIREGEFIIDGIAINTDYRKEKLGKLLLEKAIKEVKELDGNCIYLVARAPGFFRKAGFKAIEAEKAPHFFECLSCPQYGAGCHPEIMKLEV